jgi:hypothetical protein
LNFIGLGDIDGLLDIFILNVSLFGIIILFSFSNSDGKAENFFVYCFFIKFKLHNSYLQNFCFVAPVTVVDDFGEGWKGLATVIAIERGISEKEKKNALNIL